MPPRRHGAVRAISYPARVGSVATHFLYKVPRIPSPPRRIVSARQIEPLLYAPTGGVQSRPSGGSRGRRSPGQKTPSLFHCRGSCEELFLQSIGPSQASSPARKLSVFSCQSTGRNSPAATARIAVNCPSLITIHSPFRFNNLRAGEVRKRVLWGATVLGPQESDFQTAGLLLDSSAGSERAGPGIQQVGRRMSRLCYPGLWARNGQARYPFSRS